MSTSFTQVFGGTTIYPSDVSYLPLALTADITLEWPLEATTGNNVVARIIDVTPTGPYTITMPDAMSVGVGQTILFNNLGPDTITVDNAVGNAILSIGAGEQWQCYLIDNTTAGGVWRTFRYGAAVAQAQAAALAGAGLVASGSTLAQNYEVIDFSITPYSLTAPDRAKVFVWGGGLGTLNLPTAVAAGDGWFVQVRNGGQGDLTIDPSGTELINAGSTLLLQPGDSAVIVSDGIQWYTIGLGQQAVFAFDYTTIAVTGGTYTLAGSELNRIAYKFTGTLTSNANIVVPSTVQQYWVNNATTGAFTLGIKTASGAAVLVTQGATGILYCDGTNIISATTSAAFAGTVPITQGGTGAVNAPSALTNLGGTGIGTSVFTAATTAAARSAIAAAASGANSDITSLTGLTTPLSVAQGGTNAITAGAARTSLGAAASGSNADITALTNAAGIQIGAPTLGAQGAGTINATGLFINGVGVGTGSGSVTSVAATVPSFLSVTGSPVTTSGTLAISLSGTALPVANGGTGQTTYTDGQLLIGNTTGNTLTKATLTAGSGITVTNSAGGITIASTAGGGTVTSVAASGGTTGLTFTGSPITTTGTLTVGGTLIVANGGTGATSASGARLNLGAAASGANSDITSITGLTTALSVAQGGTAATTSVGALTNLGAAARGLATSSGLTMNTAYILGRTTASVGSLQEISVGTGLSLSAGSLSVSTVPVANGGTGATVASTARTNLGAAASGLATASGLTTNTARILGRTTAAAGAVEEISIGSGLSMSAGVLSATGGSGTVTSVGMTVPSGMSVSGSPVTSTGTLAVTVSNANSFRNLIELEGLVGTSSVFLGAGSGNGSTNRSNGSSAEVVAIGGNAMFFTDFSSFQGGNCTAVGYDALSAVTGSNHTAIGFSAGKNLTSGSNSMCLGANAQPSIATASDQITLGNSSISSLRCQVTTITSLSDERDKADVRPLTGSLDLINAIDPVRFDWDMRDGGKVGIADTGFTAQGLQRAMQESGVHIPDLVFEDNPDRLEAGYGKLIPALVGAIKELTARLEALEGK